RRCAPRRAEDQSLCASCAVQPASDAHKADARGRRCARTLNGMRNDVRCGDRVKLVFWDGTGVVLVAKRLEEGQFRWPKLQDGAMRLTAAELSALLDHP